MTIDFIEKRISEQHQYIEKIMHRQQNGEISMERSEELIKSAMGVLDYFEKHKASYSDLLEEVDDLLARLEDFTHGKDGEEITKIRRKINDVRTREKI